MSRKPGSLSRLLPLLILMSVSACGNDIPAASDFCLIDGIIWLPDEPVEAQLEADIIAHNKRYEDLCAE